MLSHFNLLVSQITDILVLSIRFKLFLSEHSFPSQEGTDDKPQDESNDHQATDNKGEQSILYWLSVVSLVLIILLSIYSVPKIIQSFPISHLLCYYLSILIAWCGEFWLSRRLVNDLWGGWRWRQSFNSILFRLISIKNWIPKEIIFSFILWNFSFLRSRYFCFRDIKLINWHKIRGFLANLIWLLWVVCQLVLSYKLILRLTINTTKHAK